MDTFIALTVIAGIASVGAAVTKWQSDKRKSADEAERRIAQEEVAKTKAAEDKATSERMEALVTENRNLAQKIAANDTKKTELMEQIVAIAGNDPNRLKDLIDANTTILMADRKTGDSLLGDVLKQLPKTKMTFQKQSETHASLFEKYRAGYEYAWRPLCSFVVAQVDAAVAELRERGIQVESTSGPKDFPLVVTTAGPTGSAHVRTVRLGAIVLQVYQNIAVWRGTDDVDAAVLFVQLDHGTAPWALEVWMHAQGVEMKVTGRESLKFARPPDGRVGSEVTEYVRGAIAKTFERLLLESGR
jgi:hypothetical protein